VAALTTTIAAVFVPGWLARPAGLAWAVSFALLGGNLATTVLRYRRVHTELMRHGKDSP
jgi:hypothetical protein